MKTQHTPETREVMISLRDVAAGYGARTILEHVSFDIYRRQIVTILGGSGCGKSTLLKHIIGLYAPKHGDILIQGKSIVRTTDEEKVKIMSGFGVAYQGGALFRAYTVFENVALPLQENTTMTPTEIEERVMQKLDLVGLANFRDFMPSDLSGGMVKRAAFARAMALDPAILFFDEPSAGLDPLSSASLDALILNIRKNTGATIVMVTHELPSIFAVSDRIIMLDAKAKGMIDDGSPVELRDHSKNEFVREFLSRGQYHKKDE